MGKRRASTLSEDALKAEKREAMNSFYFYETFNKSEIPLDVFGKRARDLKRKDRKLMAAKLEGEYSFALGSPAMAVEAFENFVTGMASLAEATFTPRGRGTRIKVLN